MNRVGSWCLGPFVLGALCLVGCNQTPRVTASSKPTAAAQALRVVDLQRASLAPVRFSVDRRSGRLAVFRGRVPAAPVDLPTAARAFLGRHARSFGVRPDLADLKLLRQARYGRAANVVFRQLHRGVPIFGAAVMVGFDSAGAIVYVRNRTVADLRVPAVPRRTALEALKVAGGWLGVPVSAEPAPRLVIVRGDKQHLGYHLAWQVTVARRQPVGSWDLFVDARTGDLVRRIDRDKRTGAACVPCTPSTDPGASPCGSLFFQTPVDALGPATRDNDDVDGAQSYCRLDGLTGTPYLDGQWVNTGLTSGRISASNNNYAYLRSDDQRAIDEITTYYHITRAKQYLDELGFPGVMAFSIDVDAADDSVGDNAYYSPSLKEIHMGTGGVDDGQDADVVVHEYGHAIQDNQVPGFGVTDEGGAMGEGFGDYLAVSLSDQSFDATLGVECVAAWDATAYYPYDGSAGSGCLRRVDNQWVYPQDVRGEVHDDGEIWSAALWRLRNDLGAAQADALVIEAHTYLTDVADFIDGADALVAAAGSDATAVAAVHAAMKYHGIPRTGTPASSTGLNESEGWVCETAHDYSNYDYLECRKTVTGAQRIRFHFSRFETESNYDFVYISDGDYNQVEILDGTPFGSGGGSSAAVSGDTIVARFRSDYSVTAWGFRIDAVEFERQGCITDAECDDGNACTQNTCTGGSCVTTNLDTACDDGDLCTTGDACVAGVCTGTPTVCSDGNVCTDDACNPATGACEYTHNTAPCDDGNACTTGDTCSAGTCGAGTGTLDCDDGNPCTDDGCNPAAGCEHQNNAATCDDGDACTVGDVCAGGTCQPGGPLCAADQVCQAGTCMDVSCETFTGTVSSKRKDQTQEHKLGAVSNTTLVGTLGCVSGTGNDIDLELWARRPGGRKKDKDRVATSTGLTCDESITFDVGASAYNGQEFTWVVKWYLGSGSSDYTLESCQ